MVKLGRFVVIVVQVGVARAGFGAPTTRVAVPDFAREIKPLLVENCYGCHADGESKGGVAFDQLEAKGDLLHNHEVWRRALKNVRSGLMPPPDDHKLAEGDRAKLESWIKYGAFEGDAANPDPGRVTLRRLNRAEYRNTIRDLTGVDYRTDDTFPSDDTGYGFDNIADVLTMSPMLLEKYIAAAQQVVDEAVPKVSRVPPEKYLAGRSFERVGTTRPSGGGQGSLSLSYYEPAKVGRAVAVKRAGTYRVVVDLRLRGRRGGEGDDDAFDKNKAEVSFGLDGKELLRKTYGWENGKEFQYEFTQAMQAGDHRLALELTPRAEGSSRAGESKVELTAVRVIGPLEEGADWYRPKNYERFFGKGESPKSATEKRERAKAILGEFAARAFRRPVDGATVERLVGLAAAEFDQPGVTFEAGVGHAMVAVLASPRFLFREEASLPAGGERYPLVDEYSLASRLSYFLWSSTPDEELARLASAGQLRANLRPQVLRMLGDAKSQAFVENFTGQWLHLRDLDSSQVSPERVFRKAEEAAFEKEYGDFGALRNGMRQEAQRFFSHVVREDRSVLDLLDSDYTFLNERLAKFYGVQGVSGESFRIVRLPQGSARGGVLTMGATLVVTSNPTRTSPVKRGLFLLDSILGSPPAPPPPNIPPLEEAARGKGHKLTLRESLEVHRSNPSCISCHSRMDPPGLAFENFNALGQFRTTELDKPIDPSGTLITGEAFRDAAEFKRVLLKNHRREFYACLAEKMFMYALGRGTDYYDTETLDQITAALDESNGKFSVLLDGIIDSPAFQRRRGQ